ncbi:flagellar hook-length control protein FliK [Limnobacter sp.]|uniref:flagellar hook-length control protein FliK n=1 Tax=Limnobacter sp. TaxID=2003368 RepID=UPI003517EC28
MTTQASAMNNVNKVQTQTGNAKPKSKEQGNNVQFDALFSSALGQLGSQSALNTQDSALRDSFLKQKSEKPQDDNKPQASTPAPDAALMWAQRDWLSNASAPKVKTDVLPAATNAATPGVNSAPNTAPKASSEAPEKSQNGSAQASTQSKETQTETAAVSDQAASKASAEQSPAQAKPAEAAMPAAAKPSPDGAQANTNTLTKTLELAATTQAAGTSVPNDANANSGAAPSATAVPAEQSLVSAEPKETPATNRPGRATAPEGLSNANSQQAVVVRSDANSNAAAQAAANPNAQNAIAQVASQMGQVQGKAATGNGEIPGVQAGEKILANRGAAATAPGLGMPATVQTSTNGTPGTAQTQIRTPVNQPGFARELGNTVQWAIGKQFSTVDIRVNPESFGPMNMRLVQNGQQLQLIIRTQDEASANLLSQALTGLKDVMAQQGLQLNQVQLQHPGLAGQGHAQGQAFAGQEQGQSAHGQQHGQSQGQRGQGDASGETANAAEHKPGRSNPGPGRLDLFA